MNPGIVKISYFEASYLPDFLKPVITQFISYVNSTEVELVGVGTVSEESETHTLGLSVNSTLEFVSTVDIPLNIPVAFILTDALGDLYVLGNCPPVCGVLKKKAQVNSPSDKASAIYYTFNIPVSKILVYDHTSGGDRPGISDRLQPLL